MTITPFDQGAQAFLNEASTASCGFAGGSTMHREWMDGWSQRQARERGHRSRAMAQANVEDLLGDPSSVALSVLFRPIEKMS